MQFGVPRLRWWWEFELLKPFFSPVTTECSLSLSLDTRKAERNQTSNKASTADLSIFDLGRPFAITKCNQPCVPLIAASLHRVPNNKHA